MKSKEERYIIVNNPNHKLGLWKQRLDLIVNAVNEGFADTLFIEKTIFGNFPRVVKYKNRKEGLKEKEAFLNLVKKRGIRFTISIELNSINGGRIDYDKTFTSIKETKLELQKIKKRILEVKKIDEELSEKEEEYKKFLENLYNEDNFIFKYLLYIDEFKKAPELKITSDFDS